MFLGTEMYANEFEIKKTTKLKEKINSNIISVTQLKYCYYIQGVPKDGSSNFMHYNFKSNMKFLEDVYFSIEYMYS